MEVNIGLVLLGVHLVLTCIFFVLMQTKVIPLPSHYIIFVATLPFVGIFVLMMTKYGRKTVPKKSFIMAAVEQPKVEDEEILVSSQEDTSDIVPLEEALILGQAEVSRKLLLDILGENPERFFDLLRLARLNKDTEVVHYATTVIAELSRKYDLKLLNAERSYEQMEADKKALRTYIANLEEYLKIGLATGEMENLMREDFAELLEKKLEADEPNLDDYVALVKNDLKLGKKDRVEDSLLKMHKLWPSEEIVWLLQLEYAVGERDHDQVKSILETIQAENIYISSNNREKLDFWLV